MDTGKYILDGKQPIPCGDVLAWGRWFEAVSNRRVAEDKIGDVRVSTVFLGLDHSFSEDRGPILFETMVFGGEMDGYCERCGTWEQAEEGHRQMVAAVRLKSAMGAAE
jgi:hypothetical protein